MHLQDQQPENVTFWVIVEEFGSEIETVVLLYEFISAGQSNNLSSTSILNTVFSKRYQSETNEQGIGFLILTPVNSSTYTGILNFSPTGATTIIFQIQVADNAGNSNPAAFPAGLSPDFKNNHWIPPPQYWNWN